MPGSQGYKGKRRKAGCGRDKSRDHTDGFAVIGLPDSVRACLFDLDGVLTRTATVHAAAWKEMFDGYLRERAKRTGEEFVPFDPVADYTRYVDGKPRYEGCDRSLAQGISNCPKASPATRRPPRPSADWVTARTNSSYG